LLMFNWMVDLFNLNSGKPFTLAELNTGADYSIGAALIVAGLIHNLIAQAMNVRKDILAHDKAMSVLQSDKALLEKFIELLPTDGPALRFLKEHDFGNSFSDKNLPQIEAFARLWGGAEYRFLDPQLDRKRSELLDTSRQLLNKLATYSGPVGNSAHRLRVVPDHYADEFTWPKFVLDQIEELNNLGSKAYEQHQDLIATGRGITVAETPG
jgi:hypothetical protein